MNQRHVLVIGGGGMLGLAELAALCALDRWQVISLGQFDTVIGTSIGALIALCVVCGLDAQRLRRIAFDRKLWHDMIGANDLHMLDLLTFDRDALCDERPLKRTLDLLVSRYLSDTFPRSAPDAPLTFGQLHDSTGRRLIVNATDAETGRIVLFDHDRTPDVPVLDAVRASMSVPLLFPSVTIDNVNLKDGGIACNVCGHLYPVAESLVICMSEPPNPLRSNPLGVLWTLSQRLNELERASWWPQNQDEILKIDPDDTIPSVHGTDEIELCRRLWARHPPEHFPSSSSSSSCVGQESTTMEHLLGAFSYEVARARRLWLVGMLTALTFWRKRAVSLSSGVSAGPSNSPHIHDVPC